MKKHKKLSKNASIILIILIAISCFALGAISSNNKVIVNVVWIYISLIIGFMLGGFAVLFAHKEIGKNKK